MEPIIFVRNGSTDFKYQLGAAPGNLLHAQVFVAGAWAVPVVLIVRAGRCRGGSSWSRSLASSSGSAPCLAGDVKKSVMRMLGLCRAADT